VVLVGGLVVFMLVKRWSRPAPPSPDAPLHTDLPPT
jgi:hypothetical protein